MAWGAAAVLAVWESTGGLTPPARAAAMLAMGDRAPDVDAALDLDVGTAFELLADLYAEQYGGTVPAVVSCPACGELLEADLAVPPGRGGLAVEARVDGWRLRAPTLAELIAAGEATDAMLVLRTACLDTDVTGAADPDPERVEAELHELVGGAAWRATVTCAVCGIPFPTGFDVLALLWQQLCGDARQVLEDVAVLAAAFGWSEADILALPATRRAHYLALAGGLR